MGAPGFGGLAWPAVVAHRGASSTIPENTLEAFAGALDAGADAVELDVRLTADGVPVVMHDPDVAATTDGTGLVRDLTLEEIRRLDASGHRGLRLAVPTFREAMEALGPRAGVDVEVKNIPGEPDYDSPTEGVARAVVEVLDDLGMRDRVLVSSFNPLSIELVRRLAPDVATGFLVTDRIEVGQALDHVTAAGHAMLLPPRASVLAAGPGFVADAHAAGVLVGVWTVDDPEEVGRLFAWGVDAVATNDPAAAVPLRDAARRSRG